MLNPIRSGVCFWGDANEPRWLGFKDFTISESKGTKGIGYLQVAGNFP